jgi:Protein of unknown function (DUF559)
MGPRCNPPPAGRHADAEIAEFARRQHGVVGRWQLLSAGLSASQVKGRIARCLLHPVHAGVYAVGHPRLTTRAGWMAAVLACGRGALLSHRSAAALHGLLRADGSRPDVTTTETRRRGNARIRIHRTRRIGIADRATADGIPTTSIPRTLLDLAEVVDRRTLSRAFEEADRLGLLRLRDLEKQYELSNGRHRRRLFGSVLAAHTLPPDVRSELERRFLELCEREGIAPPAVNVLVAGHVVDCLWPAERLVVELDGFAYHRTRAAHERDHERDTALAIAGFSVLRFSWSQVRDRPQTVAAALRPRLRNRAPRRGA